MDLTDIYGTRHPNTAENTFVSGLHGIFFKIDHILEYKASLNKYRKIKITSCILTTIEYSWKSIARKNKENSESHGY